MAVDVGLVEGTIAATTPNGSAISMILRSSRRFEHADGLHRTDEAIDAIGGKQILLNLVGDDAVSGLLDRQPRERLGSAGATAAAIASTIASIRSCESSASSRLSLPGAARERARLGHRGEIAVGAFGRGNGLQDSAMSRGVSTTLGESFRLRRAAAE